MAQTGPSKRHRAPAKSSDAKSRKRQKVEQKQQPSQRPRSKVRLDRLQWKAVELPDQMDDYEGFFGLEEIDDVVVVKDEQTGTVSFESSKVEGEVKEDDEEEMEVGGEEERGEEEGDDWEGFSDEEEAKETEENAAKMKTENTAMSNGTEKSADKKEKKQKKEQKKSKDEIKDKDTTKGTKRKAGDQEDDEEEESEDEISFNAGGAWDILLDQPMDDESAIDVDVSAWKPLDLSRDTLDSLSRLKFSQPTAIQSTAIPEILAGHDVIGKAATGSGKTLAFGIPILETFLGIPAKSAEKKQPLALIVSPTRELAHQISAHLTALCSGGDFHAPSIATITGGLSVQKQRRQLETANIIVGTPGRLWEVISSGHGLLNSLKRIRFLVVDEADRLLSEGHFTEMKEIINALDRKEFHEEEEREGSVDSADADNSRRQTLVFSATFHKGLQQKLAGKNKKGGELMSKQESMEYLLKKLHFREEKPKFVDANPESQMASGLKEGLIECAGTEKDLFLYATLMFNPGKRSLVFTNSISAVRRLTPFLQNLNLPALPLHSQMPQKARLRSIERFTERVGSILVSTDVAARGLDIPGVQLIIHYHLPRAADTYVHRSGRTARAEASGSSILICAPEEVAGVRRLVAKVHAQSKGASKKQKSNHYIRTLDIDRRIVSRLKPRATLAKTLADAAIAKEKKHSENDFLREAAEDLGVEYDSDALEEGAKGKRGRGSGRKRKEKEARQMTKGELQALRAELKTLLSQRVNTGVSARYLTSGGVDVEKLLRGEGNAEFLGEVGGLGFDD